MKVILAALCLSCSLAYGSTINYVSSMSPVGIPDGNPAGTSDSIVVPIGDAGLITGVSFWVNLTHGWAGDIHARVSNGTVTADLVRRMGLPANPNGENSDFAGIYTFQDGGADIWAAAGAVGSGAAIPTGTYFATTVAGALVSLNTLFAGQDRAGTWTLTVSDNDAIITGTLSSWGMSITATPSAVPEPASVALTAAGLLAAAALARRRR